ncbi:MAG: AAA family ATPase [Proteobacteria bacterium]|nr:AAA family ATPase [Pseudomonadota bacterium]
MINRELNLSKLLKKNYSALIFGARGTGKSHLAAQYIESLGTSSEVMQLNLLESDTFEKYLKQPHLLRKEIVKKFDRGVASTPLCVFIDEIQKVPKLLDEIHSLIETYPGHVQFLMTGSSARKLKRSSANLLAGRALSLRLHPFTYQEWGNDIFDRLQFGSLPGIAFKFRDDDDTVKLALKSYVSTYLKEEMSIFRFWKTHWLR